MVDVPVPLCSDCQHALPPPRGTVGGAWLCVRPVGAVHSRVTGSAKIGLFVRCETERHGKRSLTGRLKCGADAVFFEEYRLPPPPNQGSGGQRP